MPRIVSFWTPVTYRPFSPPSRLSNLFGYVEDYLAPFGCRVSVVELCENREDGLALPLEESVPLWKTILKVLSYCTVILPLGALMLKCYYRYTHRFCYADQPVCPVVVVDQQEACCLSYPGNDALKVNEVYRLTGEQLAQYQIYPKIYENQIIVGRSCLPDYHPSDDFEVLYNSPNCYEVVLRKCGGIEKLTPLDVPKQITSLEMKGLRICNRPEGGSSQIPGLGMYVFICKKTEGERPWNVERTFRRSRSASPRRKLTPSTPPLVDRF